MKTLESPKEIPGFCKECGNRLPCRKHVSGKFGESDFYHDDAGNRKSADEVNDDLYELRESFDLEQIGSDYHDFNLTGKDSISDEGSYDVGRKVEWRHYDHEENMSDVEISEKLEIIFSELLANGYKNIDELKKITDSDKYRARLVYKFLKAGYDEQYGRVASTRG